MRVAVFSSKSYDRQYFDSINQSFGHELVFFDGQLNQDTVKLTEGFDAVCVFVNDHLDAEVIKALKQHGVSLIALRCAGFNNVDLDVAAQEGIKVVRVPAYSPEAVAEHAVALILALNRKTHKAYNRVRENNFSLENLTGFNLYKKTVGIVGTGGIGRAFARIMLGFGANVIAFDPYPNEEYLQMGGSYVSFDEFLAQSDVISLHCPLVAENHHLIDVEAFKKMKKGAMLINTSRGALINTKDAIEALKKRQLGYLGIDVYEQEEHLFFQDLSGQIIEDDDIARLMTFPNVLITAHQGFFTHEALEEIAHTTLESIEDFEQGNALKHEVRPV